VSRFLLQAFKGNNVTVFGDGSQTRSFCYVADTITGLLRLVAKDGISAEAVNIGSTEETNIIDLARKIIHISASKSQVQFLSFPPGDHHRRLPDGRKAKMIIDWGPKIGLDEGLDRTVRWLKVQKSA
jgi:nucleoside-diphosphate-sugar epimerase